MNLTHRVNDLLVVVHLGATFQQLFHRAFRAFDCSGNLVHILRLDDGLEIILENLREVVYKLQSWIPRLWY